MNISMLYRGALDSCNYVCAYCPFGKNPPDRHNLRTDAQQLQRFVDRVAENREGFDSISVFFTPWGEALIHRDYQAAFARLSHLPHVRRVAAQTNLSCGLDWLEQCERSAVALWATFHPGEADAAAFVRKSRRLLAMGVRHSVGVVGLREHFAAIRDLRAEIPPEVYVWVNAIKREPQYDRPEEIAFLTSIDPVLSLEPEPACEPRPCLPHRRERRLRERGGRGSALPLCPGTPGQSLRRVADGHAAPAPLHERRMPLPHRLRASGGDAVGSTLRRRHPRTRARRIPDERTCGARAGLV